MCGGTRWERVKQLLTRGLSPRVRGNPGVTMDPRFDLRSIPACAGEPLTLLVAGGVVAVYPRVCGGTDSLAGGLDYPVGLSPRVRGNPPPREVVMSSKRSIPACAGEPLTGWGTGWGTEVYPRVCGGTVVKRLGHVNRIGLSLRVRGNLPQPVKPAAYPGSIPACAGEPGWGTDLTPATGVYPRVCGGTGCGGGNGALPGGLSPRVRGNPPATGWGTGWRGSIPACAGEPATAKCLKEMWAVYPRVCGGTRAPRDPGYDLLGLSPRVRGNHHHRGRAGRPGRSIPACAGEPGPSSLLLWRVEVYPRVCGGTGQLSHSKVVQQGLSPRVRGNQHLPTDKSLVLRSIPACAGEPARVW